MYTIRVVVAKNRLYLTLKGKVDVAELRAWSAEVLAEAEKLKPGFGVVPDILECYPTTEEGRQIIQATQLKAKEMGMGHVVRITSAANAITANQWQRSSRNVGYIAAEAASVEAADKLLDELAELEKQSDQM
jgi:hypothetical protein